MTGPASPGRAGTNAAMGSRSAAMHTTTTSRTTSIMALLRPTAAAVAFLIAVPASGSEAPRPAGMESLPTDPVLAQLIDQSLTARPELKQAEATVTAERERVPQAGALPDPTLSLGDPERRLQGHPDRKDGDELLAGDGLARPSLAGQAWSSRGRGAARGGRGEHRNRAACASRPRRTSAGPTSTCWWYASGWRCSTTSSASGRGRSARPGPVTSPAMPPSPTCCARSSS